MTEISESFLDRRDPGFRGLRRDIAGAGEDRIKRIVATIDAMATRGAADELIAPLRPRLGGMRPTRPLRFARLLFLPLDPLIVPAPIWHPNQPTIPRTALSPMTKVVEAAIGAEAEAIKARIRKHTTDDLDLISSIGGTLWREAAAALAKAEVPDSWASTGLKDQIFLSLSRKVGGLLGQAPVLDRVVTETAGGLLPPDRRAIEGMLRAILAPSINALPMLTVVLLSRLPRTADLLYKIEAGGATAAIRAATDQAADFLLGQLDADDAAGSLLAGSNLAQSGAAVGRINALLSALERDIAPVERHAKIRAVRARLAADSKARFAAAMKTEFLDRLCARAAPLTNADVVTLENAARSLRGLEQEGRAVSNSPAYQKLLTEAAEAVRAMAGEVGLSLTDQVRLIEILAGPDAALEVLKRSAKGR